jgi:hypothetical protein
LDSHRKQVVAEVPAVERVVEPEAELGAVEVADHPAGEPVPASVRAAVAAAAASAEEPAVELGLGPAPEVAPSEVGVAPPLPAAAWADGPALLEVQ